MLNIICFGEVLWDVFPNHKKIGGAPLNVAVRLQSFQNKANIISRIGKDSEGEEIVSYLNEKGIGAENIQFDEQLKTGKVKVTLNEKATASYEIKFPRAWDNIQLTESAKRITQAADALVFGSLITRSDTSKNTLYELLKVAKYKIFDINLRPPCYTSSALTYLMNEANLIKFNEEEVFEVANMLNSKSHSLEEDILFIAKQTKTQSICVTKGSNGAILFFNNTFYYNNGYHINVVDTVGAGDSFLASLISKLLKGDSPQDALNFACAVGALVTGSEGANPEISEEDIEQFITTG